MKLSNFRIQEDGSSKTILMDNRLQIAETKVSFPPKPIPQTNNIASLSGVHFQQLITIKAKVTRMGATKTVITSNGVKRKADCSLTDPSGTIKLTLWEDFINDVQEGKTYTFYNVRVIKEYKSDKLALGTTLQDCTMSESEDFAEPVAQPLELPDSFMTTEAKIEIKGLTAFGRYLSCLQCRKKIADGSLSAKILKCRDCGLTQKKDKCLENCYAHAKVSQDDNQFVVTFFHEEIKKIFDLLHLPHSVNEEQVAEALLDSPILNVTYENKSKIIKQLSAHM